MIRRLMGLGSGLSGLSGLSLTNSGDDNMAGITTIDRQILAAAGTFDFDPIPGVYDEIVLAILRLRTDAAAEIDGMKMFFNGDTTDANYRNAFTRYGSNSGGGTQDSINFSNFPFIGDLPGATATADYFAVGEVVIPKYADDKYKISYNKIVFRSSANAIEVDSGTLHWESTAAITRVTIVTDNDPVDEFVADSEIVLYGVTY